MDEQQRINISGFQKPAPAEEHVPICCAKRPNDLAYSKPETARSFDDEFANEGDPVATDGRVPVLTEGEGRRHKSWRDAAGSLAANDNAARKVFNRE